MTSEEFAKALGKLMADAIADGLPASDVRVEMELALDELEDEEG